MNVLKVIHTNGEIGLTVEVWSYLDCKSAFNLMCTNTENFKLGKIVNAVIPREITLIGQWRYNFLIDNNEIKIYQNRQIKYFRNILNLFPNLHKIVYH